MTTLLFARHGQASFGQRNYDKLSELGIKQSQLLGAHFAQSQRQVDAVLSGTLQRQQDTASHFLESYQSHNAIEHTVIEHTVIEDLNEFNHQDVFVKFDPTFATETGVLSAIAKAPVPRVRLGELFNEAMLRWHSGAHDEDYLESWTQFNQRVQKALVDVINFAKQKEAKTVLVFTSGGVIASIVANLLIQGGSNKSSLEQDNARQDSSSQNSMMAYQINRRLINTGVTSLILKSDEPRLLSLNEHSHLYCDGKSYMTWQ